MNKNKQITSKKEAMDFIENIRIPDKEIDSRLKKMQKYFENGVIIEEDLCEPELSELRELYMQQIKEKNNLLKIIKIK